MISYSRLDVCHRLENIFSPLPMAEPLSPLLHRLIDGAEYGHALPVEKLQPAAVAEVQIGHRRRSVRQVFTRARLGDAARAVMALGIGQRAAADHRAGAKFARPGGVGDQ